MLEVLSQFHFLRPWWWLALPIAALLVWLLARGQQQGDRWSAVISPQLLPFLLDGQVAKQRRNLTGWLLLPLTLAICALAGPVWQQLPQPVERNTAAVVICWDLSPSMLAEDIKPSRLERSRLKIIDLLKSRKDGLTGFVAYSGEAYVVAPLTEDVETIINLLPSLGPTTLPSVGSNPEMALQEAIKLLRAGGADKGDVLFLTDGIDVKAFDNMRDQLTNTRHRMSIWGVGGKEGAPIPLPRGGFLQEGGTMVLAKINEAELRDFASATEGYYLPLQATDADIKTLSRIFEHKDQQQQQTNRQFDQWFEAGQYLVLVLLPLCLWLFRRGWLLSVLVLIPWLSPPPADALGWRDLWYTPDQQAAQLLQQGDAKTAADTFQDPRWKGTAQYKSQNYDAAAQTFKQNGDAHSLYNAGNAYTQAGRFDEAIKAYDQALAKDPQLMDAATNKKIAQQLKELAAKQKEANKNQPKDDKNSPKDDKNQEQKPGGDNQQSGQDSAKGSDKQDQAGDPNKSQDPSQGQGADDAKQQDPQDDTANNQTAEQEAENKAKREAAAQQQAEQQAQQDKEAQEEQAQKADENKPDEQQPDHKAVSEQPADDQKSDEKNTAASIDQATQTEDQQKMEQWLRRVPDDPSGLMRNKFKYQYQERRQRPQNPVDADNNPESRW